MANSKKDKKPGNPDRIRWARETLRDLSEQNGMYGTGLAYVLAVRSGKIPQKPDKKK